MSHAKMHRSFSVERASRIHSEEICDTGVKVLLRDRFVFCLLPQTTHCDQNFRLPISCFFTKLPTCPVRLVLYCIVTIVGGYGWKFETQLSTIQVASDLE